VRKNLDFVMVIDNLKGKLSDRLKICIIRRPCAKAEMPTRAMNIQLVPTLALNLTWRSLTLALLSAHTL
jgi:hypothetical protein